VQDLRRLGLATCSPSLETVSPFLSTEQNLGDGLPVIESALTAASFFSAFFLQRFFDGGENLNIKQTQQEEEEEEEEEEEDSP